MRGRRLTPILKPLGSLCLWLPAPAALADFALNMPPGVTHVSHQVYGLHMLILEICTAIGALVFGIMGYAVWRHRKSAGAVPAEFSRNHLLEVVWTAAAVLILVWIAFPATRVLTTLADTSASDLTVKVTGYQWRWRYDYLGEGVGFFSNLATKQEAIDGKAAKDVNYLREVDHPLVLPVHRKVRFLTTSNDVIHSWWVPDLGWKKDAIPGFINDAWASIDEPGTYRGQCTELCGVGHAFMPVVVKAVPEAEFDQWLKGQKAQAAAAKEAANRTWSQDELMRRGEGVFKRICAACHQPTGVGVPGVFPAIKGSAIATGPLPAHLNIVLNGKPGTAMQAFGKQLSDIDLAGVITYERNAFGNDTGDVVQPKTIIEARNGHLPGQPSGKQKSAEAKQ
jgi:cytochrome c oxidase subunit II